MAKRAQRFGNLPAEAPSFVGRRDELAEVRRKLTAARLVSLVGPGGVGKTRLAVRIATDLGRGFPGGAWLVELANVRDPALVTNAVMAALDLRDQAATEPVNLLRSYLRDKELLLVLDNCEHLLDATARMVDDVLRAAPGVRVVATSREPLSVAGEHVLPVPPLDLPSPHAESLARTSLNDAVRLFVERAAEATGRFELTEANRAAVVDVCRRLDGLPLAIELAAVRTRALSPDQIRDRLSDRFELLTGGNRAALPRHQTLHTAIDWSYNLLTPAEQTLLMRLCVFAGRYTVDDVEAVCCSDDLPAARALDLLSALLDKSLLVKEDAAGLACYRLPETMREYARRKLRESGDADAVELRCADYYLSRCRQLAATGRYRLLPSLAWVDLEIDNIRAVLRTSIDRDDLRRAVGVATDLIWYWITRATTEGVRWLDELLARPVADPWTYFARGFLGVVQNDPNAATRALDRGVTAARVAGLPDALSQTLAMASIAATGRGDRASAQRLLDESRTVAGTLDDLGATLMTYQAQALKSLADGDFAAATAAAAEGVRLSREAGDLYSLGMMLMNQGYAALRSGALRDAEVWLAEGLRIAHQIDDRVAQCYLLGALGCCAAAERRPQPAAELLGAMENLRAEIGATVLPSMAPALAQATRSATAALGAAAFDSAYQTGRQLSRDAAVRLALRAPAATAPVAESSSGILSRRELDVARLVPEGLSNKEIGARLFISERTVESHVRNILTKLGFTSRTQVAIWMAAQSALG
ncbi:putative ATPase/DNA-binding CsgD family transcriptional regulator [Saccharothrix ecbatanensis]|uniref:Putative ATPase/DNA-binding CsgD family transcriptional regulator n=1 Tax=Saccharothrix ecbatanensis TaxID=1105145 RepID=A0A7W9HJP5_9PSEU|nr:LuxR C-terminal-related transcriptional regulator [Saccharothrix ecbatanensis]MBB5803460.1 putative ATPase/DNA-binding CsgD family transcriptional regulator [Saccharothrix ecbatanensis]